MKIIFDSEEERNNVIRILEGTLDCPFRLGLRGSEDCSVDCYECWAKTINAEVKGD